MSYENGIKVWVGLSKKSIGVYTKEFRKLSLYMLRTALNTCMQPQSLSYKEFCTNFKKGLRNGNWRRQRFLDKALFRAAMWYAKNGGSIVKGVRMAKLLALVGRLRRREVRGYFVDLLKRVRC